MKFVIKDKNEDVIISTKQFKTVKSFAKWFSNNIWMFNNTYKFMLGLQPIQIYYNRNNTISIQDKETEQWLYKGEQK